MIANPIRMRSAAGALALAVAVGAGTRPAAADVVGFGDGSGFTTTGYDQADDGSISNANNPPTISAGTLTLTTAVGGESRAAFYNTPQNVSGPFVASFTYTNDPNSAGNIGVADGFTFTFQNDSRGASAIGAGGPGLGYGLSQDNNAVPGVGPLPYISPSDSVQFYIRRGNGGTITESGGSVDDNDTADNNTTPVNLPGGDPILVTLAYDGVRTLTETLTDEATLDTITFVNDGDIAGLVGSGTAYVGFTGGTGGGYSTQTISGFTFTAAVPEPASVSLLVLGGVTLLGRRRRHA